MRKSLLAAAIIGVIATPAFADDVGVRAGPIGAGVTVGEAPDHDGGRDRTTVVKEREPSHRTTLQPADPLPPCLPLVGNQEGRCRR